jgi:hypothetical protein
VDDLSSRLDGTGDGNSSVCHGLEFDVGNVAAEEDVTVELAARARAEGISDNHRS